MSGTADCVVQRLRLPTTGNARGESLKRTIAEIQGTRVCETMTKSLDTTINSAS